jgi:hypothetical protein
MAGTHSKLAVVKLDNAGGTLTTISTYCNSCMPKRKMDLSKVTTFGAGAAHEWLAGFVDGEVELKGPWTRTADNFFSPLFTAFQNGTITSASWEYGPEGTDVGDVKYTAELIFTDYDAPDAKIEDPVEWSATFKITGVCTVGAY